MTQFSNLRLVALGGTEAPYDHTNKDSPYHHDWYSSKIARAVGQELPYSVRWEFSGTTKEILGAYMSGVCLDFKSDLLILNTDKLRAINADGSINHEVGLPKFVVLTDAGNPVEYHPIDDVSELVESNGRVLVGLRFRNDRVERRYYDPGTQSWQERDHIYRQ